MEAAVVELEAVEAVRAAMAGLVAREVATAEEAAAPCPEGKEAGLVD